MQYDIRRFDIYRKVPKDLTEPTYTGACISIIGCLFIAFLLISEFSSFLTVEIVSEMYVADPSDLEGRIPVEIDISIPKMTCQHIGIDIQDDMGRHEVGFIENVQRDPISEEGGCRLKAKFHLNKYATAWKVSGIQLCHSRHPSALLFNTRCKITVPGNFHIATHSSREQPAAPNFAHIVHQVHFGDPVHQNLKLPGSFNPLNGSEHTNSNPLNSFDYFLKVVPTLVEDVGGQHLNPYQYTYAFREYMHHGHASVPAIWFRYDLSPITVKYIEKRKPIYSFLTTVCAVVGGTFTVTGIIDSLIFTATGAFKKAQLGKLN